MKRKGMYCLTVKMMEQILELPKGETIYGIAYDSDREILSVRVTGDHLSQVPDGGDTPWLEPDELGCVRKHPKIKAKPFVRFNRS